MDRSARKYSVHHLLLALAALLLLAGCASTEIASTWRDPSDTGPAIKKLAVFAAISEDAIRRVAETRAVQGLPPGTTGVPSFTMFDKPEKDIAKVKARLAKEGFDGALIARLVSYDKSESYVPPRVEFAPVFPVYAYSSHNQSIYYYYPPPYTYFTPGYVTQTKRYVVESLLYRLPGGKPIWSAVSESVNPESTIVLVDEIVHAVTDELRKHKLLTGH